MVLTTHIKELLSKNTWLIFFQTIKAMLNSYLNSYESTHYFFNIVTVFVKRLVTVLNLEILLARACGHAKTMGMIAFKRRLMSLLKTAVQRSVDEDTIS